MAASTAYYDNAGVAAALLTEVSVPWLLALPHFLTDYILATDHCLPHMLQKFITEHIDGEDSQLPQNEWQLILDWCLAASQMNTGGNSLLHLSTMEPALSQDPEFLEWCTRRIKMSLGPLGPEIRWLDGGTGPQMHPDVHMVEQITSQMGLSLIGGVQALAPMLVGAHRGGGPKGDNHGEAVGGRRYTEDNVTALKGICDVVDMGQVPCIWDKF